MDHTASFRRALALRIAGGLGLSLVLAASASGCGAKVVVDEPGGGGAGGQGSSTTTSSSSGVMTSSSTGTTVCDPTGGQITQFLACIQPQAGGCPDKASAAGPIASQSIDPCSCLISVDTGPNPDPSGSGLCCYDVTISILCVEGRALRSEGHPVVAPVEAAERGWSEQDVLPSLSGLSAEERASLAVRWLRSGQFEHASVASFSRLSLSLLAASADAELVRAAHEAALDEVRHAKLAFSLASAYEGRPMAPAGLPLAKALPLESDLAELAVSSVIDGAVGETLAAALAAEQAAVAKDPAVKRVLEGIAEDEGRHAELAFKVIAFAIAAGGEPVREAVARAFTAAARGLPEAPPDLGIADEVAEAHGYLTREKARKVFARAMEEVVLPVGRSMVARA